MTDIEWANSLPPLDGMTLDQLLEVGAEAKRRVEAKGIEFAGVANQDPASTYPLTLGQIESIVRWLRTHTVRKDVTVYFGEDGRYVNLPTSVWIAAGLTGEAERIAIESEVDMLFDDFETIDYVPAKGSA